MGVFRRDARLDRLGGVRVSPRLGHALGRVVMGVSSALIETGGAPAYFRPAGGIHAEMRRALRRINRRRTGPRNFWERPSPDQLIEQILSDRHVADERGMLPIVDELVIHDAVAADSTEDPRTIDEHERRMTRSDLAEDFLERRRTTDGHPVMVACQDLVGVRLTKLSAAFQHLRQAKVRRGETRLPIDQGAIGCDGSF
jgi:hypothetical protein